MGKTDGETAYVGQGRQGDENVLDLRCLKRQCIGDMRLSVFHVNRSYLPNALT